jgi:hypothetical protein
MERGEGCELRASPTLQLHFFKGEEAASSSHHYGLDVDDFEAAYLKEEISV